MNQTDPRPADRPDETLKETLESIVIAFVLAFVFRAYVVEAFVIPTGSMAPTLLGRHLDITCEQCGYAYDVDVPEGARRSVLCPMCRYDNSIESGTRPRGGDRILVHKFVYSLTEPRRWDVVVFKAPHRPRDNFIKRLVGLPGEQINILDGNVYVRADGAAAWPIARKTERPRVQNAVWQPIYHSQYVPLDGGDPTTAGSGRRYAWAPPWVPNNPDAWDLRDPRRYRFTGTAPDQLQFDFQRMGAQHQSSMYPYNQLKGADFDDAVEDIRLLVRVRPEQADATVTLSTTCRLDDPTAPPQRVELSVNPSGSVILSATDPQTLATRRLAEAEVEPLAAGELAELELWVVDQEVSFWLRGRRVLIFRYGDDWTREQLTGRPPPDRLPRVGIELAGCPITLHRLELDRDLYYASHRGDLVARGGVARTHDGVEVGPPLILRPHEFFVLGDNSPLSDDGRYWLPDDNDRARAHGDALWVRYRYFDGRLRDGVVPRDLMMGRAFFVYFPAMYPMRQGPGVPRYALPGVVPNFGDMRFIH